MPSRVLRGLCRSSVASGIFRLLLGAERLGGCDLALAQQRLDPGDVLAHLAEARAVVELPGGVLEPQVEQLLLRLGQPVLELDLVELAQLPRPGHASSWRNTKRVLIGSLCMASRMASRATSSGTPDSSNITRPGFTTATQCSGLPFPEPMRVSAGFCVTGLSGKMLIHTLPPRLIFLVMAIRAASIWRFVTQAVSSDFNPKSPKLTSCWPLANPRRRPRCCFRNFVFRGSSTYFSPPDFSAP